MKYVHTSRESDFGVLLQVEETGLVGRTAKKTAFSRSPTHKYKIQVMKSTAIVETERRL